MGSTKEPLSVSMPQPSRHEAIGLGPDRLLEMYRTLLLARALDQRMWSLNRQGKAAFAISGQGQEAAQVGSAAALRPGRDFVLPYYRDLGVVLCLGMTPREVMLGFLARADDPNSGGRQMPNHWGHPGLRIITGSSPVATQIPHAAGIALASKIRGEDDVSIVYFGEGSTSQGDFHEGVNFAAVHRLPVLFFCENNGYAISEPRTRQMAVERVSDRAAAYGIVGEAVDGNDILAVYETTLRAVERARAGGGPTLIDARTYRILPHSTDDDDRRYRELSEVESWKQRDPITRFERYLQEQGLLTTAMSAEMREQVDQQVDDALAYAEASPEPDVSTLGRHVFAE